MRASAGKKSVPLLEEMARAVAGRRLEHEEKD